MGNLSVDNKILTTISSLAERLNTTKEDVVIKAIQNYARKIKPKNQLMKYAGILDENEADDLLNNSFSQK